MQAAKHSLHHLRKGDTLAQSAVSPPQKENRKLVGIWRVAGSPLLQTETLRTNSFCVPWMV